MIRTEPYKYIWKSNAEHELYNLVKDPGELVNLVTVEPEVARRMEQQLENWKRSFTSGPIETSEAEYDDVILDRLRDLGYVD